jgi:NAD(P)-dependent dehydrogenase (short-subunit alcohol dehydrogenase family)
MKNITGKVILITGSTDGLGKLVASHLAKDGATLLLHGRDKKKGTEILNDIRSISGDNKSEYFNADLSSLKQVKSLATEVAERHQHIDVFINNAGIGGGPNGKQRRELSIDGYELRFAVNYLATYLLTREMLPVLKNNGTRIINVASVGQEPINFDDVMLEHHYDGFRAYRQSKLAMIMFTFDLASELKDTGITVNAMHPASLMNTKMVLEYFGRSVTTVEEGAEALEYLAVSQEVANITGTYFDGKRPAKALPQAYDPEARKKLKDLSEKLVKKIAD